jgi:hypothetical protein
MSDSHDHDSGSEPGRDPAQAIGEIDLIRAYRLNHNLALDHSFWTNERILFAIHIGME